MKYRRFIFPTLVTTLVVSFAACGGDPPKSTSTAASSASSSSSSSSSTGAGGAEGGAGGAGVGGGGGQGGATLDIFQKLEKIPGATVVEESSDIPEYRFFVIEFDQPVDHDNPAGQRFKQRIALHHRDESAPVVLASTGYALWLPYQYLEEPTAMISGNQIFVEHRYFTPSRPEPTDWSKLDIRQAAADLHRIVEAFKGIYPAKWLSTGASKGGMTSVYHRRFYPADVDGTIAYVAPHSMGIDDQRYVTFLSQVGDLACRTKLKDFEREVLKRRDYIKGQMQAEAASLGLTYNFYGLDATLESVTSSFSFAFWQYNGANRCGGIPTAASTDAEVWGFFQDIGTPSFAADDSTLAFEPYYWQAYTQLGSPALDTSHLTDLLTVDQTLLDPLPSIDADPMFDPAAMKDVGDWLKSQGKGFLFVYGGDDPWTAGAFDLGAAQDSYRFDAAGQNHGALIADLAPADRTKAEAAVAAWAGVAIGQPIKASPVVRPNVRITRRLRPR